MRLEFTQSITETEKVSIDIPSWAKYLVQDLDGDWLICSSYPIFEEGYWGIDSDTNEVIDATGVSSSVIDDPDTTVWEIYYE